MFYLFYSNSQKIATRKMKNMAMDSLNMAHYLASFI